jgi:uncharacterized cupin superfamily protein
MAAGVIHWDEVKERRVEQGFLSGAWRNLGAASGTVGVGLRRVAIDAGKRSTPAHVHGAEEEIFYVLAGSGWSWEDGDVHEIGPDDCLVHLPGKQAHTLLAGDDGLDVLAFGTRVAVEAGWLPRAHVAWLGQTWVAAGEGAHPWARELAAGELARPDPSPRPPHIVNVRDVEETAKHRGDCVRIERDLGVAAGSRATGLRYVTVPPETVNCPPHCHSADEEVFVALEGGGMLLLGGGEHEMRCGSVVARPPGSRVAHAFRAGPDGLTYLAYGTRQPDDASYYPRTGKVYLRGLGVVVDAQHFELRDEDVW